MKTVRIEATASTRIDLAGGTIDLWPLYLLLNGGITINVAISLRASAVVETGPGIGVEIASRDQEVTLKAEDLHSLGIERLPLLCRLARYFAPGCGFRLETEARVPAGSGLGGSSTMAIAVCGAFNELTDRGLDREEIIGISRDVEAQVLQIPTGEQDYYAAAYGGLNAWHFEVNRVRRETYNIALKDLQDRMLLFYSGLPRSSGINNWQVFKQYVDGDPLTRKCLARIHEASLRLHDALKRADWEDVFDAVAAEWEARKALAPAITTPDIDEILAFGIENGCRAGKVCGAGGGGCLILMMPPDLKPKIANRAPFHGFRTLDFQCVAEGLTVTRS